MSCVSSVILVMFCNVRFGDVEVRLEEFYFR